MRQVFLEQGTLVVKEVAEPFLDDHSVLVSVQYSCISSISEIAAISNASPSFFNNVPRKVREVLSSISSNQKSDKAEHILKKGLKNEIYSPGYSCSGSVIAVGKKVRKFRSGDLVACAGAGHASHADIVCIPEHLAVKVSDAKFLKAASMTTLGAVALQGIRRAQLQIGERVCILGLGLMGQLLVQLAKRAGAYVIAVGLEESRIALAKDLGADAVYHADDSVEQEIHIITQGQGVDATLIGAMSAGLPSLVRHALPITRKKGRIVTVGDVGLDLDREFFYKKEIDLLVSCSECCAVENNQVIDPDYWLLRWTEGRNMETFVQLIQTGALSIDQLLSHEVTLDSIEQAYREIQDKKFLAIALRYAPTNLTAHSSYAAATHHSVKPLRASVSFVPAKKDLFRVGFIGASGRVAQQLLPIVSTMRSAKLSAVVDVDQTRLINVGNTYGVSQLYTQDAELFQNDLVDVVIVSSPDKQHTNQALIALEHGKAVFLEKPMVINAQQLNQLSAFLDSHPAAPFCVDYSRSFSPFIKKIKKVVEKRRTPLMLHYRMNAGHSVKEFSGNAGSIVADVCHIIDIFYYLTNAKAAAVSVESVYSSRDDIFPTDNVSVQVSFDDGSVCSLLYTTLGHEKMGSERIEAFFDGKSIVMDDYVGLYGMGLPSWFNETVTDRDKGQEAILNEFFQALRKDSFVPPISFERLKQVSHLALIIDQLVCEGGGKRIMAQ